MGAYVTNVITSIHHFYNALLARLCTEERVITALWSLLMDGLIQRYRKTVEHVHFVLQTERSGNLLTTNHYFSEILNQLRSNRSVELNDNFFFSAGNATRRTSISNIEYIMRNIYNILKFYYKVTRKRFIDNIYI